jgi:hypothetical protein
MRLERAAHQRQPGVVPPPLEIVAGLRQAHDRIVSERRAHREARHTTIV